uniref:Uncharacterized protein n=1 Tax=Cynoglossus semilaevis TaxID=244447 RepID=A0A3P8UU05_CYNSE
MAEQEQQPLTELDAPVDERSRTGRAVSLARLLHLECTNLLQLYKERETFLLDHTPGGERIVTLSPDSEEPSTEEKVHLLHLALRQCLGLLHCVIQKEQEEWGELEADYETLKQSVCVRLQHLLHTTKDLLQSWTVEVTPDHQCTEETDGPGGAFGLKMWTYRVLLELIHWAGHATQTLHLLHKERVGAEEV